MGTDFTVRIRGLSIEEQQAAADAVRVALDDVDDRMSTWKSDSELSRLNRARVGEAVPLSPPLRDVLRVAREVHDASGGAFDVTVGPAVDAWGFGPSDPEAPPSEPEVAQLMERIGMDLLVVTGDTASRTRADLSVDLSAVAKGYAVDRVLAALADLGHHASMVEVGGEIRVGGGDQPWRIAIERPDPRRRQVARVLSLQDISLATSGDYRNVRRTGDGWVSHTIDPRTARPVTHGLASVSVLAVDCARADAWATALNVLGPKEGLALARELELAALLTWRDVDGGMVSAETPAFTHLSGVTSAEPPRR